eukprot:CAMPEP_0184990222 /NCGR_PEP_ID=MMETSP1098-20130426/31555_1 /TAXON_ID=89044 /ORGANISM="Spumella elongata, Strain CCAP 955/1" /LENGTH=33 /DNA_ID= /DNA_START= /DNA_END= /DNA_ORIENTATION=
MEVKGTFSALAEAEAAAVAAVAVAGREEELPGM